MVLNDFKEYLLTQTLSESSIHNYISKLETLISKNLPLREEGIIDLLESLYPNVNTRKGMLYPVIKLREFLELPVELLHAEYKRLQNEYLSSQKEQVSNKILPVLETLKKCRISKNIPDQDRLVFLLYTKFPAIRNDYIDVKFRNYDTEKDNYYNAKTKEIVINNHKTSKVYDELRIKMTPAVALLIKKIVASRARTALEPNDHRNNDFLLNTVFNHEFSTSGFTTYTKSVFKNICGYELSSSDLRKIWVINSHNKSLKDKEALAEKMGHGVATAELHYNKIS